jgi:hypothetical protein
MQEAHPTSDAYTPEGITSESVESFDLPELLPEEQVEEYLARLMLLVNRPSKTGPFQMSIGTDFNTQAQHVEFFDSAILKAEAEVATTKFSTAKIEAELAKLPRVIKFAHNAPKPDSRGLASFEHTNRERWFYGTSSGFDDTPYSQLLFGVHCDPELSTSATAQMYFKRLLDNKTVLMLGGGDSAKDFIAGIGSDDDTVVFPRKIINVDLSFEGLRPEPLIQNSIESGLYIRAVAHAENPSEIREVLDSEGLEIGVDEIWASFSVPYYLDSSSQIKGLFQTIRESLSEGGIARLSPIAFQAPSEQFMQGFTAIDETKATLIDEIQALSENPDFNVYSFPAGGGDTLVIKRLKKAE